MKRRTFLKNSALASGMFFVPNFIRAFENLPNSNIVNKKLIVIQLSGGNDGLNTIIPYRNDLYYKNRPNISISKNNVLNLNGELGLHPNLTSFKNLFEQGYLNIINNVGYPNPNRSHFRSTDIWNTASDSNKYETTGWIGRYLDTYNKPSYDAIDVNERLSLALKGNTKSGIAAMDPNKLYENAKDPFLSKLTSQKHLDEHLNEDNLGYLYKQLIQATSSASYIHEKYKTYTSNITYPNNILGNQLKTIANFINSGLESKVYYANLGGFDTHFNQIMRQQNLMKMVGESIETLVNDLKQQDNFKDTLIMIFSEFGRRVEENASKGTDHGTANQVYLIGQNLKKPGIVNESPNLDDLDENGDIKYKTDFRQIYTELLDKWLNADPKIILTQQFNSLNLI